MKFNKKKLLLIFLLVDIILSFDDSLWRLKKQAKDAKKTANNTTATTKGTNTTNKTKQTNKTNTTNVNNTSNSTPSNSSKLNKKIALPKRISANFYKQLNTTFVMSKVVRRPEFMKKVRNWDYKLLDKQIESLYQELKIVANPNVRELPMRGFIDYFLNNYEACDKDGDNVLNLQEFIYCMNTDKYLKELILPNKQTASFMQYTNATNFHSAIFELLDEYNNNYLNFHDYMLLRLIIFSLKRCSVLSPSIDMNHFSCSIERASGLKSFNKLNYRKLFEFGLEISNNESLRNLDFVSYLFLTLSMRVYGKINGKRDADISIQEMKIAINHNVLPYRYSRDIIDQYFKLIDIKNKKQGIDYRTFTFLDFCLRLFTVKNARRPYHLSFWNLLTVFKKQYFPKTILNIIKKLPQIDMIDSSFNMKVTFNTSKIYKEDDYLMKFLEFDSLKSKLSENAITIRMNKFLKLKKIKGIKMKFLASEDSDGNGDQNQTPKKPDDKKPDDKKLDPKKPDPKKPDPKKPDPKKPDTKKPDPKKPDPKKPDPKKSDPKKPDPKKPDPKKLNDKNNSSIKNSTNSNNTAKCNSNLTNCNNSSNSNSTKNISKIQISSGFNLTKSVIKFFILLDSDDDGYLSFEDFGHFMQLSYLFMKLDKSQRGLLSVGKLNDMIISYNNYPMISDINVDRAKRLRLLNKNLLLNIYEYLIIFRIDNLVKYFIRQDGSTLLEVEIKSLLKVCGLEAMPEMYLTKCLKGSDKSVPRYDWECAVMNGLSLMSQYYEAADSYLLAKANKINLVNTAFNNIDRQLLTKKDLL